MSDLEKAADEFHEKVMELSGEYITCPTCGNQERTYPWKLYATAVKRLALYYYLGAYHRPVSSQEVVEAGSPGKGDETRLVDFGLLYKVHFEGEGRNCHYRLTKLGVDYLLGLEPITEVVTVFGAHNIVHQSDKKVYVYDKVERFDLDKMLRNET